MARPNSDDPRPDGRKPSTERAGAYSSYERSSELTMYASKLGIWESHNSIDVNKRTESIVAIANGAPKAEPRKRIVDVFLIKHRERWFGHLMGGRVPQDEVLMDLIANRSRLPEALSKQLMPNILISHTAKGA